MHALRLPLALPAALAVLSMPLAAQQAEVKIPRPVDTSMPVKAPPIYTAEELAYKQRTTPQVAPARLPAAAPKQDLRAQAFLRLARYESTVHFDTPGDGNLWAMGDAYKVRFGKDAVLFAAHFGPEVEAGTLQLALRSATVAGTALPLQSVDASRADRTVTYARGSLREVYQLTPKNMEQLFVFDTLPARGELVVDIDLTTDLRAERIADGWRFANTDGYVDYTKAIAIDADGRRLPLEIGMAGGDLQLRVPASFVAEATLPLTIDPLVGLGETTISTSAAAEAYPDVAYDVSNDLYAVVWQRRLSATDTDVWCQRVAPGGLAAVGASFPVDFTFDVWQKPKIANHNIADRFLVVAQVSVDDPAPYWIKGRIFDAAPAGALLAQFDVSPPAAPDETVPDVGGDPILAPPTYFTVVYEYSFAAADHDIHMRQVQSDGTLRGAGPTAIDGALSYESNPSISKCDGQGSSATQRWAVAYQRTFNALDEDIRGRYVTWDGVLSGANFSVDFSGRSDTDPTVSSPAFDVNGVRNCLFAYQGNVGGQGDIIGSVYDTAAVVRASADLNLLEGGGPYQGWSQGSPSVDSDGCRFALAYYEQFGGAGADYDVQYTLLAFDANTSALTAHESRLAPGFNVSAETWPEICSMASSGGPALRYCGVWMDNYGAGNDGIEGQEYNGHAPAGGVTHHGVGCGGLTINTSGVPAIGAQFQISLSPAGLNGYLIGIPFGAPQPIAGGGCLGCNVYVNGSTEFTDPLNILVPRNPSLVGGGVAFQGFSLAGGSCLGFLKVSDWIEVVVQ